MVKANKSVAHITKVYVKREWYMVDPDSLRFCFRLRIRLRCEFSNVSHEARKSVQQEEV